MTYLYYKYTLLILIASGLFLIGCDYDDAKITGPPPPAGNDSLLIAIDSIGISNLPYYADTILSPHYNFLAVDSVKITFNVETTSDSNFVRLVFSELDNFNNRLIPFICGHIYGQCQALVIFNLNPSWNDFSLWFWLNVIPNSTMKIKNIRIYKAM